MTGSTSSDVAEPNGNEPWRALVESNLPLVRYVLGKLAKRIPQHIDRNDLLSAGSVGLVQAARRYDASRNVPFHSYALPRIWGAMLDELRKHDWVSADVRSQIKQLHENRNALLHSNGAPTFEELAESLGCSTSRVARLEMLASLDPKQPPTDVAEGDAGRLCARLGATPPRGPFEQAEFEERKRVLARAIEALPERERRVVMLRYHQHLYLQEIGDLLSVSESRVSQILTRALKRLRTSLIRAGAAAE